MNKRERDQEMKLWLLRPRDGLPEDEDPWNPWYDKTFGMVIRASTEEEARTIASRDLGGMEMWQYVGKEYENISPWNCPDLSTCVHLEQEGKSMLIMRDHHAA